MIVLDASAVLAFLGEEPGGDAVREAIRGGSAVCSAANWAEVAQKSVVTGRAWGVARMTLMARGLQVEPVIIEDAEYAAALWPTHQSLCLADRLCLALAHRLGAEAWTADSAWGSGDGVHQIR